MPMYIYISYVTYVIYKIFLSLIFIYPSIYLCTYLSIHEFILISNSDPEVLGTFLPFLPLAVNSLPNSEKPDFLYPFHLCSFVEACNTQKVVKRKPTNLSSIISSQFFLNLKFIYIQIHKHKLYNLMRHDKRVHLLNHIPIKT